MPDSTATGLARLFLSLGSYLGLALLLRAYLSLPTLALTVSLPRRMGLGTPASYPLSLCFNLLTHWARRRHITLAQRPIALSASSLMDKIGLAFGQQSHVSNQTLRLASARVTALGFCADFRSARCRCTVFCKKMP